MSDVNENPHKGIRASISVNCGQKVWGSFTLRPAPERVVLGLIFLRILQYGMHTSWTKIKYPNTHNDSTRYCNPEQSAGGVITERSGVIGFKERTVL